VTCLDLIGLGGESESFEICEQAIFGGIASAFEDSIEGFDEGNFKILRV
jgi:hypothetical protein